MARVTVVIVTWNSATVLPECLVALRQQRFRDFSVQVIDNVSTDGTPSIVSECYPQAQVLKNFSNAGFARANNQGISLARSEYVLVHNPDVAMRPDGLERLVAFADGKPAAASFCPKLLRHPGGEAQPAAVGTDDVIDAAGLCMTRSRVGRNRGEGERDRGQFSLPEEVFGAPGACALYRRSALMASAVCGEFFDASFFAYKEDVDLAWRLRLLGFSCWYVPTAVAYHRRTLRQPAGSWWRRFEQPAVLRLLSLRNYLSSLVKNEQWPNAWRDALWLTVRVIGVVGLLVILEPLRWRTLTGWLRTLPSLWRKRSFGLPRATATPASLRQWFTNKN